MSYVKTMAIVQLKIFVVYFLILEVMHAMRAWQCLQTPKEGSMMQKLSVMSVTALRENWIMK